MGIAMLVSNLTLSTEEFCVLIYIDLLFFKFCFSCATFIFSSSIYKILSTDYNEALLQVLVIHIQNRKRLVKGDCFLVGEEAGARRTKIFFLQTPEFLILCLLLFLVASEAILRPVPISIFSTLLFIPLWVILLSLHFNHCSS